MKINQINRLVEVLRSASGQSVALIDTHISWVLLCNEYAYKIKKPLQLSFLDFSTIEKRKHFCLRELSLNQRLTSDMYLDVFPIRQYGQDVCLEGDKGEIIDYCLKMRRLDNTREMRSLLIQNKVAARDIKAIAHQLTAFHRNASVIKEVTDAGILWDDFKDIEQINSFVLEHLGTNAVQKLKVILSKVQLFLEEKKDRIKERDFSGYIRDCHGDLHSGNIFLLDQPVIFDCIEFNDHFRYIDLLSELAFICMDLEFYSRQDFSDLLLQEYISHYPVIVNDADAALFLFYKLYRSNIKVKVNAIKCMQRDHPSEFESRFSLFKEYFELMLRYADQLFE